MEVKNYDEAYSNFIILKGNDNFNCLISNYSGLLTTNSKKS